MKNKWILSMLIVLMISLGAAIYFFLFRLQNPVKVYKNIVKPDLMVQWQNDEKAILKECKRVKQKSRGTWLSELVKAVDSTAILTETDEISSPSGLTLRIKYLYDDYTLMANTKNPDFCEVILIDDKSTTTTKAAYFNNLGGISVRQVNDTVTR